VASELAGKVAIVTGGARNIGRAIVLALAEGGAAVVVNARSDQAAADAVAAAVRAGGGRAVAALADVSDERAVAGMVGAAIAAFGRIDIVVNNAAIRRETALADLTFAEWREVLGVTLDGAFLLSRAALPHLIASGHGAIVNIGGLSAHTGARNRAHVVAAKAALGGLTKALAHELGPHGITVNTVAPGLIDTVRGRHAPASPDHHRRNQTLVGRRGTPEEVAAWVRRLAGPDGRYITGQTIHVNGGAFLP
jgi:3-oxoacyl-[acyl-carrier protein] reductase